MNQENNNLNENNLNAQSNNTILNSQPMNNQNVISNQQSFNNAIGQTNQNIYSNSQQPNDVQTPIKPIDYLQNDNSVTNQVNAENKKNKTGLIIGIIIALIVIILGIIFIPKLLNKKETSPSNETVPEQKEDVNKDSSINKIPTLTIYLNNQKIILGKTTMDEIINNTDLEVISDETNKHEGCTSDNISLESKDWVKYDKRIIKLSDGINTFVIESYFEKTNIAGEISTLATGHTDDPEFNNTKGTTLAFEDNVIGTKINIGDSFSEDEYYDIFYKSYCQAGRCPQTDYYSNDMFIYYFDNNYKIINMSATLMSYYS